MAPEEIDPSDQIKTRTLLSTKIRNYFLIFVGIAILITIYFLISGGSGSLFKGFIGEEPPTIPDAEFPPTIVSTSPINNATDIATESGQITVVFDEAGLTLDPTTNVTILSAGSTDDKQVSPISYVEADKSLIVNYADLEGTTAYTLTVPAATISNGTEPMDSNLVLAFISATATTPTPTPTPTPEPTPDPDPTPAGAEDDLEITDHDVFPVQFNPLTNETKISYEISADAKIDINIIDHTGVTVLDLLEDEDVEAGDYYVWWDGTDGDEVVASGEYTYKIYAKDPNDGEVKDIKSGEVQARYSALPGDFEDVTEPIATTVTAVTPTPSQSQAAATVSLQSAETGVTAGTGTPVLIYLLFPLGGLFISRKKK
ncbi:MAG: Ig-like domain-containing protein [Nitrospirota bacterium]